MIEGDPFHTQHRIDERAIKGAMLVVASSRSVPTVYTVDQTDSANMIAYLMRQWEPSTIPMRHFGHKPKRIISQQLLFLQGLPHMGATMAHRLAHPIRIYPGHYQR